MAERRSKRKRKDLGEKNEPTKEENEIGKHLRWNCPVKNSTMMGQKVEYFIASKAVDCLLDSKWASGKGGAEILFTDRASVITYLHRLLELEFFYRVHRIKKKKGEGKEKEKGKGKEKEKEKEAEKEKGKEKEKEKEREVEQEKELEKTKEETGGKKSKKKDKKGKAEEGKKEETEGKKKRKVKVKLEMHDEHIFADGDENAYAWIFDPVHPKTFVMGILVVIAAIAICMFPLWPMNVREYVWYLSVAGAVAIGMLLLLGIVRYITFAVLWAVSMGKHNFWLLPNLYAECGFLESFAPLYEYEYKGTTDTTEETKSDDKSEKEDEDEEEQNEKEKENRNEKEKEKDSSSDDKESTDGGMKDSWVKLTEEEVENARTEVETIGQDLDPVESTEAKC